MAWPGKRRSGPGPGLAAKATVRWAAAPARQQAPTPSAAARPALRNLSWGLVARRPAAELEDRTMPVFSYDPPDRFVAGTVGPPGVPSTCRPAKAAGLPAWRWRRCK